MKALPKATPDAKTCSRDEGQGSNVVSFNPPYDLPSSWRWLTLPQLGSLDRGRSRHRPRNDPKLYGGPYPFIQTGDVRAAQGRLTTFTQTYSEQGLAQSRLWPKGTLCITIAANIAETAILGIDACFPDSIVGFLPDEELCDPLFVEFFIRTVKADLAAFAPATAQKNINLETLKVLHVPCPPLNEQRQLVAKVSSLFANSKTAREELGRIPRLVERYKQAILSSAFRGEFTKSYRSISRPHVNTPADVVASLRSAHFREAGIQERPPLRIASTPEIELPCGWQWISVDGLSVLVEYGSSAKTSDEPGSNSVPVLRMGNIVSGHISLDNLKYLPASHHEFPDLLLEPGDILFNRTNSAELVGKSAVFRNQQRRFSFASYLIRLRVVGYLPELLSAYINSEFGREWVRSVVSQQVGQANVNGTKLRELGVPLMPMDEQKELLAKIQSAFNSISAAAAEATRASELLNRFEESALAKAFRGELATLPSTNRLQKSQKSIDRL
jgi:restriction endonuclease S subunit